MTSSPIDSYYGCACCGKRLSKSCPELTPEAEFRFICEPCFINTVRNKIYLTNTGQSQEMVRSKVSPQLVKKLQDWVVTPEEKLTQ